MDTMLLRIANPGKMTCPPAYSAAAKKPATGDQQCSLSGSALDRMQRLGFEDPLVGCSPVTQGLEAPLRLRARAAGNLRGIRATQRHLLQGCQLDQHRAHCRQGQEVHKSQQPHPSQRHLALSATQKLRHNSLQIARWVHRIFSTKHLRINLSH